MMEIRLDLEIEVPEIKLEVGSLKELRKTLHSVVDGAWAKPEMLDAKDALEKVARESGMADCLRRLWEEGTVSVEAYRACIREAGIPEAYRKAWGK